MQDILLSSISTLGGVVISGIVAWHVSRRQARIEVEKVRLQIAATFEGKLHEKRMDVYPIIAKHLGETASAIRKGQISVQSVRETWDFVREWDATNSIFMSPFSMTAMIELRRIFIEISKSHEPNVSNNKARDKLLPAITNFQLSLKTELGVMHGSGFHSPHQVQRLRETLSKGAREPDDS